jgi:hypothetical protein
MKLLTKQITVIALLLGSLMMPALESKADVTPVPIPVNVPVTITTNVEIGMTQVEIPFDVAGADGFRFDAVVPVNGAQLGLFDPSGVKIAGTGDANVTYTSGETLNPGSGLPGGVYSIEEILSPTNGTWKVVLSFPAATNKTVIVATLFLRSAYQVGIVIDRTRLILGEDSSVGIIVLSNGIPILGLHPTIRADLSGASTTSTPVSALDDGLGADGLASDGIYSVNHIFDQAGTNLITGEVAIPTANGIVLREASTVVVVTPPSLQVQSINQQNLLGSAGCVSGVNIILKLNVLTIGNYSIVSTLRSTNGNTLTSRVFYQSLSLGIHNTTNTFLVNDIKSHLSVNGPYNVTNITIFQVADSFDLQYQKLNATNTSAILLSQLCVAPIQLLSTLQVTQHLSGNLINSLDFAFPVVLTQSGFYSVAFKVVGVNGENIAVVAENRSLTAGTNNVVFSFSSDKFLAADGPFSLISLLVLGPPGSAQLARVGQTDSLQRWQFLPKIIGDLNNDGHVDSSDRQIILNFLNKPALVPGDRRDLNGDGKIDLKDAREILKYVTH